MAHKPPPLVQAGLLAAGLVLLQALLVMWFAWPAQKTAPRDLPVVVPGPARATGAVVDRLRTERHGAFEEGDRTQQRRPGAGRQQLADRTPRLGQQLRRRRQAGDGVADEEHEQRAEAEPGVAQQCAQTRDGRADRQGEEGDDARGREVRPGEHTQPVQDTGGDDAGEDREGEQAEHAYRV